MSIPSAKTLDSCRRLALQRGAAPVVAASLSAAAAMEPRLSAWVSLQPVAAMNAARRLDTMAADPAGDRPLHGVPVALKDSIAQRDQVCSAGSLAYRDFIPGEDATVVARLRQAGAVVLGRCNMYELADGVTSENPHYGSVRNPWRSGFHPGGSSGGSAVSVATGTVVGSLGTDTGGSVRIPSSLCGVVGLKPSRDLVPTDGVLPLSPTLDHVGPMARTVRDLAVLLSVISGRSFHLPPSFAPGSPPRAGVLRQAVARAQPAVAGSFQGSLELLGELGWELVPVELEGFELGIKWLSAIYSPEAAAVHERVLRDRSQDLGEQVRRDLLRCTRASSEKRVQALASARRMARDLDRLLDGLDCLILPTTPRPAVRIGHPHASDYLLFTSPFNLTGHPAISLPMALSDGLPVGLQMVGRQSGDFQLLELALFVETAMGFSRRPPIHADTLPDSIAADSSGSTAPREPPVST